jgi:hypothetical protein
MINKNFRVDPYRFYFDNPDAPYVYDYGKKHSDNSLTARIQNSKLIGKYDVRRTCCSAQLIIHKVN